MANIEKDITEAVLSGSGQSAASLGLRFDKVVIRLLGRLRSFTQSATPRGRIVLVAITAPIRSPAETAEGLEKLILTLSMADATQEDRSATIVGNGVRVRLIDLASARAPKLVGFAHNANASPDRLLDLAENWLRAQV